MQKPSLFSQFPFISFSYFQIFPVNSLYKMIDYAQIVSITQEDDLFSLLNQLRVSRPAFQTALNSHSSALQQMIRAGRGYSHRSGEDLGAVQTQVNSALRVVEGKALSTRLHLSPGLCQAARDVLCSLGTFGFIAPVEGRAGKEETWAVSSPFYPKYGRLSGFPVLENFAYGFANAIEALCAILTSTTPDVHGPPDNLFSPDVRVVGIAAGSHQSLRSCLVLISCGNYFEKQPADTDASSSQTVSMFYPAGLGKSLFLVWSI